MVANIRGFTTNYAFKLINFDTPRWHTLEYSNWQQLDAILKLTNVPQMRGEWSNSTAYLVGDRVIDVIDGHVYRALVQHTSSAPPVEFADERIAHSTYWVVQIPGVPLYRGEWTPNTTYALGDIVKIITPPATVAYQYQLCINAHTSNIGTFPVDVDYWTLVFDATNVVLDTQEAASEAAASASEAASSATVANDAAVDASTAADAAQDAADAAANSASNALSAQGAFRWNFINNPGVHDPGAGNHVYNNANVALATKLSISGTTADPGAPSVQNWLMTWDDSTSLPTKGTIYVRKSGFPDNFFIYNIIGTAINHTTWVEFDIEFIAQFGSVLAGEQTTIGFSRTGNAGNPGPGTGDMLGANNLSDVSSPSTSRTNLGVGAAQTPSFAQVLLSDDPTQDGHAITKRYLDSGGGLANKVNIDGSSIMTGPLKIHYTVGDQRSHIDWEDQKHYVFGTWQDDTGYAEFDISGYGPSGYYAAIVSSGARGEMSAPQPVQIGDEIGFHYIYSCHGGVAGNGFGGSASWGAIVDAAPVPDVGTPIGLTFRTGAGFDTGVERLRIGSDGNAIFHKGISVAEGISAATLYVSGGISTASFTSTLTPTTGRYYFGTTGTKYLEYDGTQYAFAVGTPADPLVADSLRSRGSVWSGVSGVQGAYRFGSDGANKYLFYDATNYILNGGGFVINNPNIQVGGTTANGVVNFGNTAGRNLQYDGAGTYTLNGGSFDVVSGRVTARADMMTIRAGDPAQGLTFYGNSGAAYIHYVGGAFNFTHHVIAPSAAIPNIAMAYPAYLNMQQLAGSLYQAGPGSIVIRSHSSAGYDPFISYWRDGGGYAANMGMMNDNRFGFGGWSVGGGVQYRFWSREDFGESPVHNTRLVYVGDYVHSSDEGLTEPYGPTCCQTGGSGANLSGFGGSYLTQRYRALQIRTVSGYYGSEAA